MSMKTYKSTGQSSKNNHEAITRIKLDKVLERDQKLSELVDRAHAFQQAASQLQVHATMLKRKYKPTRESESLELLSNSSLPTKMEGTSGSRAHFCPRLVDYIAIVGTRSAAAAVASSEINSTSSFASSSIQVPELLRMYPLNDHKDFPLSPDSSQAHVDEVVGTMGTYVDKVLERDQKLNELDDRADALQQGASQFKVNTTKLKRKYWFRI